MSPLHQRLRNFTACLLLAWAAGVAVPNAALCAPARPNILWIVMDDVSPTLGCYGDSYATSPNLDRLARDGIRYERAFAPSGVCATSRSSMITSVYASTLGTQHMRSLAALPSLIRPFPVYLREVGYHTFNWGRTDYNFEVPAGVWDESGGRAHWRSRRPGQPFFGIFSFTTTHESRIRAKSDFFEKLPPALRHDPAQASLPAYLPDTPAVRGDWARYHDTITLFDRTDLAKIQDELADDGLADDTILIVFGDQGVGLPRAKQFIFEAGLRIPLIIHFPVKWRHLAPAAPGSVCEDLVSVVDFGASMLSLLGLPVPREMQGRPFLGAAAVAPRDRVYGIRDRMDERIDMNRTVRDTRWKYHRNYHPYLPHFPWLTYMELLPTSREMRRLAAEGALTGGLAYFLGRKQALEELYDLRSDPDELVNLAGDPRHRDELERMRAEHFAWVRVTRDTGFIPEHMLRGFAEGSTEYEYGQSVAYRLDDCIATARLMELGPKALPQLLARLRDDYAPVRYWAVAGLLNLGRAAAAAESALLERLADTHPEIALAAAEALCGLGKETAALPVLARHMQDERQLVRIAAGNVVNRIGEKARPLLDIIRTQSRASKLGEGRFLLMVDWLMADTLRNLGEPYAAYSGN